MACDAIVTHIYVHVTETQTNTELSDFSKTEGKRRSIKIVDTVLRLKFTSTVWLTYPTTTAVWKCKARGDFPLASCRLGS